MIEIIGMHEAKSTLSQLVQRAAAGETILIGRHGRAGALRKHVEASSGLPDHHRDLFDRLLVSQAIAEPMMLLTADAVVAQYGPSVESI